jgi:sulfur carrier protein
MAFKNSAFTFPGLVYDKKRKRKQVVPMDFTLNGVRETLDRPVSLADLLQARGYPLQAIVLELNGALVPSTAWERLKLSENDVLEILRFVGGG